MEVAVGSVVVLQGAGGVSLHMVIVAWTHVGTLCTPCSPPRSAGTPCPRLPVPLSLPSSSLCPLFASLSLHTCSSPSLPFFLSLSSSSPCLSLSLSPSSYLIPLVFLLSACPADLHACCVEAAQLDLMPPAARSRADSGLGAPLLRAGEEEVGPPLLAPFLVAFPFSSIFPSSPFFHCFAPPFALPPARSLTHVSSSLLCPC